MGIGTSSSSSGASAPRAKAYAVNRDAPELRRSRARKAPASAQPGPMHVIYFPAWGGRLSCLAGSVSMLWMASLEGLDTRRSGVAAVLVGRSDELALLSA